jgi:hypothetical protein
LGLCGELLLIPKAQHTSSRNYQQRKALIIIVFIIIVIIIQSASAIHGLVRLWPAMLFALAIVPYWQQL